MAAREPGRVILLLSSLLVIDWIFMKFPSATWGFLSVFVLWYMKTRSLAGIILEMSQLTSVHLDKQEPPPLSPEMD